MKEEVAPELYHQETEQAEQTQQFGRIRHTLGALASGAYMLTFGPTARRVWGGAAGASAAFFVLTPHQEFEMAGLQLEISPDLPNHNFNGSTVDLNGLGRIEYPTHNGPATVIKPSNEQDAAKIEAGITNLRNSSDLSNVEKSAKQALLQLGLTSTLVAIGGAAGAAAIDVLANKGKQNKKALITALSGVAATGIFIGGLPYTSQNPDAISEAKYVGLVADVTDFFGGAQGLGQKYQNNIDEFGPLQEYLSVLRDKSLESQDIPDDAIGVVLAGDTHCMPGVFELIANLAQSDDRIQMLLLDGDHTDFGTVQENQLCFRGLERIQKSVVAIAGNHDSNVTMEYLAKEHGVTTLDDTSTTVNGVTIFGRGDTTHSPSMTDEADHGAQEYITPPVNTDILLAARPATAKLYEGKIPTLVAGDTHQQEIKELDQSVFINPGTAGAAFLRAFEKDPAARRTVSVLYLDPTTKDPIAIVEYDFGEIGQREMSVNTCTVVDRDDNLKVVC